MSSRSEYPAPFMKRNSLKLEQQTSQNSMKSEKDSSTKSEQSSGGATSAQMGLERSGSFSSDRSNSFKLEPVRPELHSIDEDELQRKGKALSFS